MKIGAVVLPAVSAIGLRRPRPLTRVAALVAALVAGVSDRPRRRWLRAHRQPRA